MGGAREPEMSNQDLYVWMREKDRNGAGMTETAKARSPWVRNGLVWNRLWKGPEVRQIDLPHFHRKEKTET